MITVYLEEKNRKNDWKNLAGLLFCAIPPLDCEKRRIEDNHIASNKSWRVCTHQQ